MKELSLRIPNFELSRQNECYSDMIKPILYHRIEEKNRLEAQFMSTANLSKSDQLEKSKAFMNLFAKFGLMKKKSKKK
jgi:hypothetical protein